jgi:D-alanyl-D-alanine carboxypeptidase
MEARPPDVRPSAEAHRVGELPIRQVGRLRGNVPGHLPDRRQFRAVGIADGEVPGGTTVFADIPAVANLNPALLAQLRRAATEAAGDGVELDVNSGWRSDNYQEQLFQEAVAKYGSEEKAERWVARPGTSVHEAGDAVDIGPSSATTWLGKKGADFGLCQIYLNEPWHYELRADAIAHGCPATYADPTHDPRMQQ